MFCLLIDTKLVPKAKITVWLANLLDSPDHNPSVISWENEKEKLFKINDQHQLAQLWGLAKENPKMNYDNFR